jgi:mono/diheme cytochrome c family protein
VAGAIKPDKGRCFTVTLSPCHLVTLALLLAAGCDWPGKPNPDDRPVPSDKVLKFETLFQENCRACHGDDGKGGPAPPLNDPLFLALVTDAQLLEVIREGRYVAPGQKTPMPGFSHDKAGPLTDAQIEVLAEGIRKKWGPGTKPDGKAPPDLRSKENSKGNKEDGIKVFASACASCHGEQGQRGKYNGREIGAINDPAFLALISDRALRRYAITGRPDFGMPDYAGKEGRGADFKPLTDREVTDLVALLAYWRLGGLANGK